MNDRIEKSLHTPTGPDIIDVPRRRFMSHTGGLTLSAAAVALLGGAPRLALRAGEAAGSDIDILNAAIAAELQAIAAYQVGAESGLLGNAAKQLALQFQGHHRSHADLLRGTVMQLGGTPAEARSQYDFPVDTLKNEADVLKFAAGLERGAVSAYLSAVPQFGDRALAKAAASILGDEAMHWAVLLHALGEDPVPAAFVS